MVMFDKEALNHALVFTQLFSKHRPSIIEVQQQVSITNLLHLYVQMTVTVITLKENLSNYCILL